MSETPVVIVPPRKGIYHGDDGHHHDRIRRRRHNFHACGNLLLRLLTAGATAAAVIVMLLATQRRLSRFGIIRGRWKDFSAYKWFIIANSIVFVYAVLGALVALISLGARRGPLSYSATAWVTLVFDFMAACILISAASAALAVALLARNGHRRGLINWPSFCSYVTRYCDYSQGAIIASFIGFYFMGLSTLLAASALRELARRRHL